jgi:hypothetical protein
MDESPDCMSGGGHGGDALMKGKTILYWLCGALVSIFFLIFFWQQAVFSPAGGDGFTESIERAMRHAAAGDWENAGKEADRVRRMWSDGNALVALKYAESDYTFLNVYLIRFDRAVKQRDVEEVVREGGASIYMFENMTSIVPKP